jgi:hypothetical protein
VKYSWIHMPLCEKIGLLLSGIQLLLLLLLLPVIHTTTFRFVFTTHQMQQLNSQAVAVTATATAVNRPTLRNGLYFHRQKERKK